MTKRISIKFFTPDAVNLAEIVPVFQRWIQDGALEGLLIDVVDYKHVYQGPGVILIGHEGDYGLDVAEGRAGLMFTLKQNPHTTLPETLAAITRLAVIAAQKLTEDTGITFAYNTAKVAFLDRLSTPNTPETFEVLHGVLVEFVINLFGDGGAVTQANPDPREPFAVTIATPENLSPEVLLARVGHPATTV